MALHQPARHLLEAAVLLQSLLDPFLPAFQVLLCFVDHDTGEKSGRLQRQELGADKQECGQALGVFLSRVLPCREFAKVL